MTAVSSAAAMRALVCLIVFVSPVALAAQQATIPSDWIVRSDVAQQVTSGDSLAAGRFRYERMPPGWHMTTTTSAVSVFPRGRSVQGAWGIEVELFLFPNPSDQPFGVIVESADQAPSVMALQFLLRRDGAASIVAVRDETPQVMVPWTKDTTITPHNGKEVKKYVLRVMHQGARLTFVVNGTQVLSMETGGEDHRSIPGLRVGAGINLHVSRFDLVTPLAPVAGKAGG